MDMKLLLIGAVALFFARRDSSNTLNLLRTNVYTPVNVPVDVAQQILQSTNATQALAIGNAWLATQPQRTVNMPSDAESWNQGLNLATPIEETAPVSVNPTGIRYSDQFSTYGVPNTTWKADGWTFSGEGSLNMTQASWTKAGRSAQLIRLFETNGGSWQIVAGPTSTQWAPVYW